MGVGNYIHYQTIADFISAHESELKHLDIIQIDVCTDGFKPFKSSALTIWPVMCAVVGVILLTPFLEKMYGHFRTQIK